MMNVMPIPLFSLAALGLIVTWRRWKQELMLIYLIILLTIGQSLVFYGSSRFRAPIEPLLVILAGGTIWWFTSAMEGSLRAMLRKQKEDEDPSEALAPPIPVLIKES
jgi:hypothetical protein